VRRWLVLALGSTLLAAGCGERVQHAPPPAGAATRAPCEPGAPGEPAPREGSTRGLDEAAVVAQLEALAAVHCAHKADCAALAREITAFRAQHPELAAASKAVYQRIEADDGFRQRTRAAMSDVMSSGMACKDAAEFKAARAELATGPH
jgi:hypothetical protein